MTISIMQPGYLPWLGFFDLMQNCRTFVVLDDVQYTKKDWRSRNRIRTKDGWLWLSVPVLTKGRRDQLIKDAQVNNSRQWGEKHLGALKANYCKAPFFKDHVGFFEDFYLRRWELVCDLDLEMIAYLARQFRIGTKIIRSSSLDTTGLAGNAHILEICKKLDASVLYDSAGAREFIDTALFKDSGIEVVFQDYLHPVYNQAYHPFLSCMSAVDLLFNEGEASAGIIASSLQKVSPPAKKGV